MSKKLHFLFCLIICSFGVCLFIHFISCMKLLPDTKSSKRKEIISRDFKPDHYKFKIDFLGAVNLTL